MFFYNTAPGELQHLVYNTMSDYIAEGYVTEVNWPYESCVHGMARCDAADRPGPPGEGPMLASRRANPLTYAPIPPLA